MTTGKKILIGALCGLVGIGAVGGVCYQQIPSFRTTINSVLKNDNDSKSNISFTPTPDDVINDDNSVKPITPNEFLKTYKFELPTTFLGGSLYVKQLINNDLLVSSSVCTSILYCNAETEEVIQTYLANNSWKYFTELSNGDYFISSSEIDSGLLLYDSTNHTITPLLETGYAYTDLIEFNNGNCLILKNKQALYYMAEIKKCEVIHTFTGSYYSSALLSNNNVLISTSSTTDGLVLFNSDTKTFTTISTSYMYMKFCALPNGKCLMGSYTSTYKGIYLYDSQDDSITQPLDTGYNYEFLLLDDGSCFIAYAQQNCTYGYHYYDIDTNQLITVADTGGPYTFCKSTSTKYLVYRKTASPTRSVFLIDTEANTTSLIYTVNKGFMNNFIVLKSGNVLISCNEEKYNSLWIFNSELDTISTIPSAGYDYTFVSEFDNGDCLIGSSASKTVLYYDHSDCTVKTLLSDINVTAFEKQKDGTVLIKTTDDYDYEYNPTTDTVKLVYTVEQEVA